MRRLRGSDAMRRLCRAVTLSVDDLVQPMFVRPGEGVTEPLESLAECLRFSPDTVADEAEAVFEMGIPAILLFGSARFKDAEGSDAWADDGTVQCAVRAIKKAVPGLVVMTDVCLCGYTESGHCGVVRDGKIDNDVSCELLAKVAVSHAAAGADLVAPSDMMDGRVGVIRDGLERQGFCETAIMAYSAKYASSFYGPFRDVADSAPAFGDRRTYQMAFENADEAMREMALDIEEGADIVMVKPAMVYLDVICRARERFDCPIAGYHVSGEYMMVNSAADAGVMDRDAAMMESLYAIRRAGANIIITYFARRAAELLIDY